MLLDSNLFFLSVISSNSQKFFRNYPPDLIISIVKSNICLQIFPVNLASITGNLPFFDIFNLTAIYCEIILLFDNFILLQNLLKWKMFFKYLMLRKICLHKTYLWITTSILVQSLPTQKIPINNLFLNQNPWYQKSPFDKNIT